MQTKQGLFLDVGEVGKNKGDKEQLESCVEWDADAFYTWADASSQSGKCTSLFNLWVEE